MQTVQQAAFLPSYTTSSPWREDKSWEYVSGHPYPVRSIEVC